MNLTREDAIDQLREALAAYPPDMIDDNLVERTITELAQAQTDIYNWDRLQWVAADFSHHQFVEDAIEEFEWEGVGSSFLNAIEAGQYLYACYRFQEAWEELQCEWEREEDDWEEDIGVVDI